MAISFVAAGTEYRVDNNSSTAYTLNAPAGLAEGHFMLALVIHTGVTASITPPTGWTQVGSTLRSSDSIGINFSVLKRTAGASEPSSWTDGVIGSATVRRSAMVYAWSGCADATEQLLVSDQLLSETNASSLDTPTINNTDANGWRVCMWAHYDTEGGAAWTSNEVATRGTQTAGVNSNNVRGIVADSDGVVATGTTSRTGILDWYPQASSD
jgi:hypothetical protein